jgi:hypothetical protein
MVHLTVRITKKSERACGKLENILNALDLKITEQHIDKANSTYKLSIDASLPHTMNLIISIAQSRFQEDLLSSKSYYENN